MWAGVTEMLGLVIVLRVKLCNSCSMLVSRTVAHMLGFDINHIMCITPTSSASAPDLVEVELSPSFGSTPLCVDLVGPMTVKPMPGSITLER